MLEHLKDAQPTFRQIDSIELLLDLIIASFVTGL